MQLAGPVTELLSAYRLRTGAQDGLEDLVLAYMRQAASGPSREGTR